MLKTVDQTTFERSDIVARCAETGAYLCKSRAQWSLVVESPYVTRHWSRHKVSADQILDHANKALEKIKVELVSEEVEA